MSVKERPDLVALADPQLLSTAAAERRAVVTNNPADFMPLHHEATTSGRSHFGIVFTSDRSMPRSTRAIGLFVRVLDALLDAEVDEQALRDRVRWLP